MTKQKEPSTSRRALEDVGAGGPVGAALGVPVAVRVEVAQVRLAGRGLAREPGGRARRGRGQAARRRALRLRLQLAARGALLLLQAQLLRVGLVPQPLLHEPLVGPQPRVGGRHALLGLVQLRRQHREVVEPGRARASVSIKGKRYNIIVRNSTKMALISQDM